MSGHMSSLSIPIKKYAFPFCEGKFENVHFKRSCNLKRKKKKEKKDLNRTRIQMYQPLGHKNLTEPVNQKPVTTYVTEDK